MNEYIQFAKETISKLNNKETRADSAQAYATVAIASALIGLAEILERRA